MANESLSQNDQVSDSFSWAEIYINVMLNIVLIFLILFGNVMIVCSYKANHALRTGSNTIILSLAISDIVFGVVSIPAWCYISLSGWQSSGWAYSLFKFFDILSASSSTLHLTSITIDRYVAISRPFYHAGFSSGLYHKTVAALWSVSNNYGSFKQFGHAFVQSWSCTSARVNFRMFKRYNDFERWYFSNCENTD